MRVFTLAGRRQTLPTEVRELLTAGEAAWLERGNTVELEVLRPVGLIRAIYRDSLMLPKSVTTEQEVFGFMVAVWNCICGIALDKRGTTAENRM